MISRRSFLNLMSKIGIVASMGAVVPTVLIAKEQKPEKQKKIPQSPASIPSKYWDFEKGEAKIDDLIRDAEVSKIDKQDIL